MGNYEDVAVARFWIKPASLSSAVITGITDKTYTGKAFTPKPVVKLNGKALILNKDYYLAYKYNLNVSESEAKRATVAVKGKGNYKDVAVARFRIKPASLRSAVITGISDKTYTGETFKPKPDVSVNGRTLVLNRDYYLAYKYNTNVSASYEKRATVAVKGMGNYKDVAVKRFWIKPASLSDATISEIYSKTYTGKAIKPKPVVKLYVRNENYDYKWKTLKLGTDYTLAYKYNTNVSKDYEKRATVAVKGKGNYKGTAVARFVINPASIANATVTGITSKVYTGKEITPSPVVKVGGRTLKLNTDYTLDYYHNTFPGKASITINGKGNYSEYLNKSFIINPKPVSIVNLSSPNTKQIRIVWDEPEYYARYQVEFSTSKDFSKPEIRKYTSATYTYNNAYPEITLNVSKSKTVYYVRIRAIVQDNSNYYSAWSPVKTVKTK